MTGIITTIIKKCMKLLCKDYDVERTVVLVQFIKFGIVGVSNTVLYYVVYLFVLLVLSPFDFNWDYIAGNMVAFFSSTTCSFYWNNKYVFAVEAGKERKVLAALLKTYAAYGFSGIILSNILSYVWINIFGISKYLAPLINLIVTVPVNFVINKFWAFKV